MMADVSVRARYWTWPRIVAGLVPLVVTLVPGGWLVYLHATVDQEQIAARLNHRWEQLVASINPAPDDPVPAPVEPDPEAPPDRRWSFDVEGLSVPQEMVVRGGPGKDQIPSLTTAAALGDAEPVLRYHAAYRPKVVAVAEAGEVDPEQLVVGLTVAGESRAYPLAVLRWHECVNDVLGGVPVAVIHGGMSGSVVVVDRRVGDAVLEFGVSGLVFQGAALLYDRTTHGLWSPMRWEAVSGPLVGTGLRVLGDWGVTSLGAWRAAHPEGSLLTDQTGHKRPYDRNPYQGYAESEELIFEIEPLDRRIAAKLPVVGIRHEGGAVAARVKDIVAAGGRWELPVGEAVVVVRCDEDGTVAVGELPEGVSAMMAWWFAWAAAWPQTAIETLGATLEPVPVPEADVEAESDPQNGAESVPEAESQTGVVPEPGADAGSQTGVGRQVPARPVDEGG